MSPFAALFVLSFQPAGEDLVLVSHGSTRYEIVRPEVAPHSVSTAAAEFQKFVERSTGVRIPIVTRPSADKPHVFIGGPAPEGVPPDGFHARTAGADLHIAGADTPGRVDRIRRSDAVQCGTLYGVYDFLERHVGVTFAWHDELGTVVPKKAELRVPPFDRADAPDWEHRLITESPSGGATTLFGRRLGLGTSVSLRHTHSWHAVVPVDKYGKDHPEYFALVDGARRAEHYMGHHGGQLCTTNPDVIEIAAREAVAYFNRDPREAMFALSPNDGGGFCQCAPCRALDVETLPTGAPVLTDRILTFYNAVAERLVRSHPTKRIGAFVYADYVRPPRRVKPHPNLTLVHASNSAFDQGAGGEGERKDEAAWLALTPHFYKYDIYYYGDYGSLHLPAPVTRHIAEKLPAEHRAGFRGGYLYMGQTYEQLGAGHYLLAKLMWDKEADVETLERRYYDALYGPAGPDAREYYRLLEERLRRARRGEIRVDEPAVAKAAAATDDPLFSAAYLLAAYGPILDDATRILERARRRTLSAAEGERLSRVLDHHDLLLGTVRGVIAAGRLDGQISLRPEDLALFRTAVALRQAARKRLAAYAPELTKSLDEADAKELAVLSPRAPYSRLAAYPEAAPAAVAVRASGSLRVDGNGDEAAWQAAPRIYLPTEAGVLPQAGVRVALLYDDENLYLLAEGRDAAAPEDVIELRLGPGRSGAVHSVALDRGAFRTHACGWSAELSLPFRDLGARPGPDPWRAQVFRRSRSGGLGSPVGRLLFSESKGPLLVNGTLDEPGAAEPAFEGRNGARYESTDRRAYGGPRSGYVQVPDRASGTLGWTAPVRPDTLHGLSFVHWNSQVKIDLAQLPQAPRVKLEYLDRRGRRLKGAPKPTWDGAAAADRPDRWRPCRVLFVPPAGTASVRVSLVFVHAGEYWVDEVRLEAWE